MLQCGCVEHKLEYIMFYVQKHINTFGGQFWILAGSRRAVRGARFRETGLLCYIHPTLYYVYGYLSPLGLKLIHVRKGLQDIRYVVREQSHTIQL